MEGVLQNAIITIKTIGLVKEWRMCFAGSTSPVLKFLKLQWYATLIAALIVSQAIVL
jgi:hypothetical protein